MTYRELAEFLKTLSEEELDLTATVYDPNQDEYIAISEADRTADDSDVLDPNHPVLLLSPF